MVILRDIVASPDVYRVESVRGIEFDVHLSSRDLFGGDSWKVVALMTLADELKVEAGMTDKMTPDYLQALSDRPYLETFLRYFHFTEPGFRIINPMSMRMDCREGFEKWMLGKLREGPFSLDLDHMDTLGRASKDNPLLRRDDWYPFPSETDKWLTYRPSCLFWGISDLVLKPMMNIRTLDRLAYVEYRNQGVGRFTKKQMEYLGKRFEESDH